MGTIFPTMMRKRKKKRFDSLFHFSRHPISPYDYPIVVRSMIVIFGLVCLAGATFAFETPSGAQNASGPHGHDYVIFATVFTDRGFALFGARARVRRSEEKKFRWETTSDHQGELAFRVPRDAEYEMTIEARGFKTQTQKIDAREDNRADLTVRMEPQSETGSGGKP